MCLLNLKHYFPLCRIPNECSAFLSYRMQRTIKKVPYIVPYIYVDADTNWLIKMPEPPKYFVVYNFANSKPVRSGIMISRISFTIFVLMFLAFAAIGQTAESSPDPEKEKLKKETDAKVVEIIDQAISDGATLQTARNRAIVFGMAGDLLWKFDNERASELFRRAGNELALANAEYDKDAAETDNNFVSWFDNSVRNEVLPLIAKREPDLALELLLRTRPAKITEAMARISDPNAGNDANTLFVERMSVQQELALEQRFALLVAENDPDRAVKMIKESLAKGISWNVMPLLQKLHKKSEKKAAELADEVVRKITNSDLTKNREDMDAAIRFIESTNGPYADKARREKQFMFSTEQLTDIANKLATTFLQPSNSSQTTMHLARALPVLEKLIPSRAAQLRNRHTEALNALPSEFKSMGRQQRMWNPSTTPEEMLAEIGSMGEFEKSGAYMNLVQKIAQIEDETRARGLIEKISDQKTRERAVEQFEAAKISRIAKAGRLEDARKLIGNLSKKKTRIEKLVALATEFYKLGGEENLKSAAQLMRDARSMINEYPGDEEELADLMQVVSGYAVIDPPEAFRLFAPLIDQFNEVVNAYAVLSKYSKRNQSFRKGELILKTSSYSGDPMVIFRFTRQLELLGKADLFKMASMSERFQRADTRIFVRLFLAQGFVRDEKELNANPDGGGSIYYSF